MLSNHSAGLTDHALQEIMNDQCRWVVNLPGFGDFIQIANIIGKRQTIDISEMRLKQESNKKINSFHVHVASQVQVKSYFHFFVVVCFSFLSRPLVTGGKLQIVFQSTFCNKVLIYKLHEAANLSVLTYIENSRASKMVYQYECCGFQEFYLLQHSSVRAATS